ncbi:hypothetical protein SAMN05216412_11321 [Nitrosospira multiformis]|uniref:SinR family protein n=1 Tax=Nitrosospira multiformis TaxID=1231 RepID=A0A1I0GHS0_9PROT|nr:SinR family protein [Nitrosospira multiformis]SET69658.1 hypothetical protein SAMN05216412_11321 [Nitrosospira multiformis]
MATYMVGYDLNKKGQSYTDLIKALEGFDVWWHCLDSTWLVNSNSKAIDIVNYLAQFIDSNDELLVIEIPVGAGAAWIGFDKPCSDWLKNNL